MTNSPDNAQPAPRPVTTAEHDVLMAAARDGMTLVSKGRLVATPTAQAAPAAEYKGWYCAHCQRGVDSSDVTYHEQHAVCGRVITNDRPPAAGAVAGPSEPTGRTDAEIVEQTEELAAFLLSWAFNHEPGANAPAMRDSTHPFAQRAWSAACHIQDMLTQTDVQNALAELEDAPEPALAAAPTPAAQADSVLEDAARGYELVGYINRGIEYHNKGKTIFHIKPTQNLKARWWTPDIAVYAARKQGGV